MVDQVKVIEIGADAIEAVFQDQFFEALNNPPMLMHAIVAALGRHGFIIEDQYVEEAGPVPPAAPKWPTTSPDWETSGDEA